MAASVQLLLNTNSTATTLKASKSSSSDDGGDDFQAELTRASDRQKQDTKSSDNSDSSDDKNAAKKTDDSKKSDSSKKTQVKGKPRKTDATKTQPDDDSSDTTTDDAAKTTAKLPSAGDTEASTEDEDATKVPTDGTKPVAKDKPAAVDPTAVAGLTVAAPTKSAPTTTTDAKNAAAQADDTTAVAKTAPTTDQSVATVAATNTAAAAAESTDQSTDADDATAQTAQTAKTGKAAAAVSPLCEEDDATVQPKQVAAKKTTSAQAADSAADDAQTIAQYLSDLISSAGGDKPHDTKSATDSKDALSAIVPDTAAKTTAVATPAVAKADQPPVPPDVQFADTNHPEIVKSIQTQLLPHGGTMQLRLDPPELGALQVTLSMKDGVMNATFQTSNEDAARLLSHSMTQLKTAMESAGMTVDKLQVQHTPRDSQTHTGDDQSQSRGQPGQDDLSRQQEQQRKDMIKRMWRKLSGENDPLDLVA